MAIISLDLWGTLIKGSPEFQKEKLRLAMNSFECNQLQAEYAFKDTKDRLNFIIERTGWMPTKDVIIKLLCSYFHAKGSKVDLQYKIYQEYQKLAVDLPPLIWSEETIFFLEKLSMGNRLILSSNTMLFNGTTLTEILKNLGILKYFHTLNFSDQLGLSKPAVRMYSKSDFHIGDNITTDKLGAENAGSIGLIINSNDKTIANAYDFITTKLN